jgi:hypothetical protein
MRMLLSLHLKCIQTFSLNVVVVELAIDIDVGTKDIPKMSK